MSIKEQLKPLIHAGREKEASVLLPHVDDSQPAHPGRWTARDNLAHMSAWRRVAKDELHAAHAGGGAEVTAEETEDFNAKIYAATRDLPAKEVLEEAALSWESLLEALEACTEEELLKSRLRRPEQPVWQVIPGNTYFHVGEHLIYWLTESGDAESAEGIAQWAYELASSALPGVAQPGTPEYNLGCFYAARGRAAEAMPYLRRGIELNPRLREWARDDKDLDPIRSAAELISLLA